MQDEAAKATAKTCQDFSSPITPSGAVTRNAEVNDRKIVTSLTIPDLGDELVSTLYVNRSESI